MEGQYYVDRLKLRQLMDIHPEWKQQHFVEATGRSVKWVKKWQKRLREADPEDRAVLSPPRLQTCFSEELRFI